MGHKTSYGTPPPGPTYPPAPTVPTTDATGVGSVAGAFDVSPTGAAVYTMAIEVPPGVGGVQPQVALVYNSQGGNGIAGWGCNLSGISAITRVPKSVYYDGVAKGLTHTTTDEYALDGQRLILESGSTAGKVGAIYHTEADPYTRITCKGDWFEVVTKDGIIYWYGRQSDSKQTYTKYGTTVITNAWYLHFVQNTAGNYMNYKYLLYDGYMELSSIAYGYVGIGGSAGSSVTFTYESRLDKTPFVINGVKGSMQRRLSRISSQTGSSVFREYWLNYSNTDHFSRLTSVTVYNDENELLNPTTLQWNKLPSSTKTVTTPTVTNTLSPAIPFDQQKFMSADMNGDGLSDIIGLSDNHMSIYYASLNSQGSVQFAKTRESFLMPSILNDPSYHLGGMIDYDGDGIQEFFMTHCFYTDANELYKLIFKTFNTINNNSEEYEYAISASSNTELPLYCVSDFNNDGQGDILVVEKEGEQDFSNTKHYKANIMSKGKNSEPLSLKLPSKPEKLFVSDYNGDGLVDMLLFFKDSYKIFWNKGQTTSNTTSGFSDNYQYSDSNIADCWKITPGDFNGDGLQDFLMNATNDGNWYFALNNGDGTFTKQLACTLNVYDQSSTTKDDDKFSVLVYDFDFDGKSDAVITKAQYTLLPLLGAYSYWLRSTGTTLSLVSSASSSNLNDALSKYYIVGDFDGDGQQELMNYSYNCYNGSSTNMTWRIYKNSTYSASSGKITAITNGYGNTTNITYDYLTRSDVYAKGSSAVYPMMDIQAAFAVVKTVKANNGAAGNATLNYNYTGAKVHTQGKGFLGFASTSVTDHNGLKNTSQTAWNTKYYIPDIIKQKQIVNRDTSETTIIYKFVDKGGKQYEILPESKTEKDFDRHTSITSYKYNDNGNLREEKTIYDNNSGIYRTKNYDDYVAVGGTIPNKPQRILISQKHLDDNTSFSQQIFFEYDAIKGYVKKKTENADTPFALVTDYLEYDACGNLKSYKVSGADIETMTYYTDYDATGRFPIKQYTSPATTVQSYQYDTWGNVTQESDETNSNAVLTTKHTYNSWGQKKETTLPDNNKILYKYGWNNPIGTLKCWYSLVQATGKPWTLTWYDNTGREKEVESIGVKGMQIKTVNNYNSFGELSSVDKLQGKLNVYSLYRYDSRGRVISLTENHVNPDNTAGEHPIGKDMTYAYSSRTISTTNNLTGRNSSKMYDAWGNVKTATDEGNNTVYYTYKSLGKPKGITAAGATVSMEYDAAGNQTKLVDPAAGTITYKYDALGRLTKQTDARGNVTENVYDIYGRLDYTTIGGVTTDYTYGESGYEKGLLTKIATGGNSVSYQHDQYGRSSYETRAVSGSGTFTTSYGYTIYGQLQMITYPGSVFETRGYDSYGNHIKTTVNGQDVWELTGETGRLTTVKMGAPLTATTTRNVHGMPTQQRLSVSTANVTLYQMDYTFSEATGNLMSRSSSSYSTSKITETFEYDALDRLTNVSGADNMVVEYASNGNIEKKTNVGTYKYDPARPHAVDNLTNLGNLVSLETQEITYTAFHKAEKITEKSDGFNYELNIMYGPDQQRWKSELKRFSNTIKTIVYAGGCEEVTENGTTQQFYYINGVDGLTALYVKPKTQSAGTLYYVHKDHLGSIRKITTNQGASVFEASYDAWGKQSITKNDIKFHRGYTGHEHLPEFALINMNGRMYDPIIGRMLSPDNYVQAPDFSQSYNRYSYCLNNPLRYTDPSGDFFFTALLGPLGVIIDAACWGALIGGAGNLMAHTMRGDINSLGDGLKFFGQGALAGAVLGAAWAAAPMIPAVGPTIQTAMKVYGATQLTLGAVGTIFGAVNGGWDGMANGFNIFLGNFYLDEHNFWGGVWQGISRHTWEMPQTVLGQGYTQVRNLSGNVDRVHYLGGATFATNQRSNRHNGISLGNFINMNITGEITGDFDTYATTIDPMYMHEYGHYIDSQNWGVSYLLVVGIPSLTNVLFFSETFAGDPYDRHGHDYFYAERWANKRAKKYFEKHYGDLDWSTDSYGRGTIEDYYPTWRK